MLIDGLNLAEGSTLTNAIIASGTEFPPATQGELFFRSDLGMLHVFNGQTWLGIGNSSAMLDDHPGSYYLDLGNATGILSVAQGGTGVATLAMLRTNLGLDNVQPLDGDLTAIAGIQTSAGLLRKTAENTWELDTATYLTDNQPITVTGDVTGAGATAINTTLANVGAAGTYRSVTTDVKGRVISGSNPTTLEGYGITDAQPLDGDLTSIAGLTGSSGLPRKVGANSWVLDTASYITGNQTITITGDVTGSGTTAIPLTLASVGAPGTYKSITTDSKGRVTAGTNPTTLAGFGITDALKKTDDTFTGTLTMVGDIVPATNVTYNLGSPTKMWRDIYVGPGSIYMNGKKILEEVASTVIFSSDDNQNVRIETTGTGNLELQSAVGGAIQIKGTLSIASGKRIVDSAGIQVEFADDIAMNGNKVTGLAAPTVTTDAANKAYVDNATLADTTLVRTTGNQSIAGQKTFTGDVILAGNLTISGTTTTVNSQTVLLADNILELNSDFTAGTPSENAGIQIRRGDLGIAQFLWDEANDRFTMMTGANAPLPLYTGASITAGSFVGPLTGNASTATKLATARTINGASFDGTANISYTTDAVVEGATNLYFTNTRAAAAAPVQSVFGRTGAIALTSADVTGALAYTPANKAGDTFTGNITAPTFIGALTGNASTATTLQTARTINGVSFNGSANISFTTSAVAEGTNLYHTTARAAAAAPVQSVFGRTGAVTMASADVTTALGFTPANIASPTFTGTVTAPTFVGALSGNASTATKLATARTINGVSFDGSANITLPAATSAEVISSLGYAPTRQGGFTSGAQQSVSAITTLRNVANPSIDVGYATGVRFRFGSQNDADTTNGYADIIDLSTYVDSTGGGVNALYFNKSSQLMTHKFAPAGATTWVAKTVAYTDSNITGNAASATKLATARTINGVAFDGTANITVADATKLPLTGGTLTGSLTMANGRDIILAATTGGTDMGDIVFQNGDGTEKHRLYDGTTGLYYRLNGGTSYLLVHAGNVGTYNAGSATKLATARNINGVPFDGSADITITASASTVPWTGVTGKPTRTTWNADTTANDFVAGQLTWRYYGNSHTIFDAGAGVSPTGATIDKNNPQYAWATQYPTLMGWNGTATYGVRVDTSRYAENTTWGGVANKPTTVAGYGITDAVGSGGTFAAANVDTIVNSGYYNQQNSGDSHTVIVHNAQGSTGTVQQRFHYMGGYEFRNRTDNANWSAWKTVVTNLNVAGYVAGNPAASAPKLTGPAYTNGTDGWFRNTGQTGWFNDSYSTGLYPVGAQAIGTYNNSRLLSNQGTPALPSFSFGNDADTGIYSPSDGILGFSVNAVQRATLTGDFSLTGGGFFSNGLSSFKNNKGSGVYSGNTANFTYFYSDDSGAAGFSFHRGGAYAVNMALDPDNVIRIGGWSASANRFAFDMGGNFTAAGDVAAFSDERRKTNWRGIDDDFVQRWATVKHGVYERIDEGNRDQLGLGAQSVQAILPNAVHEDSEGYLSLNYGAAAGVATVKLAQKVVDLEAKIAMLEAKLEALMGK